MKNTNITVEDIAKALNLSRNTVSKVLNGKRVSAKTRMAVLGMVEKLNYKNVASVNKSENLKGKTVLLISSNLLMNIPFHIYAMKGMETVLMNHNASFVRYTISKNADENAVKNYLEKLNVDAIICAEFFQSNLVEAVLSLNLPTVFLDFTRGKVKTTAQYDIVSTENINSVKEYCETLIGEGCKSFGFVGDINNCLSFYERYLGMRCAIEENGLTYNPKCSIMENNALPYSDISKITNLIKNCDLPDCFVCANDFLALIMLDTLNNMGINVPEKVKIIGFENSVESNISNPTLSTINVNKIDLGKRVVSTLLSRMKHRSYSTRYIYVKGDPIRRASTNYK